MIKLLHQLTLPLYQLHHLVVIERLRQLEVDIFVLIEAVDDWLHSLLYHLADRLGVIQLRLLLQKSYAVTAVKSDAALIVAVLTCNDAQQAGFAGPVESQNTNFGSVEKRQPDVFEHLLAGRVGL